MKRGLQNLFEHFSGRLKSRLAQIFPVKSIVLAFALLAPFCTHSQIITTVAGNGSFGFSGDNGPATESILFEPLDVVFDGVGNYYIADYRNFMIRKVNANGVISTVAGNGIAGYSGDGDTATNAQMNGPTGIAIDRVGNIYIADYLNNVIRKVDAVTHIISTVAGIGASGYEGDGNAATKAELKNPAGVAVDWSGNLYISDNGNNVIRKVNTSGIISTIAGYAAYTGGYFTGIAGYSGDGGAPTAATLYSPKGLFVDGVGNLYIADEGNNAVRVVQPGLGGLILTVAGSGLSGYSGDGGPATAGSLSTPENVAVDGQGNLFISELGNNIIRKVNTAGVLSTIAGNDTAGYSGNGGPAIAAELNGPFGLAFDPFGNLYFADKYNSVVRMITSTGRVGVSNITGGVAAIQIFPNPNTGIFTVNGVLKSGLDEKVSLQVTDMLGRIVYALDVQAPKGVIRARIAGEHFSNGMYLLHMNAGSESNVFKFVVER